MSDADARDEEGREGEAPSAEAQPEPTEADREELPGEVREALDELDQLRDKHLRLAAEFENYRKRTRRQLSEARQRAQADLAERLLESLDDMRRLLDSPLESTSAEALQEGVEMVHRKLAKELSEAGLERMAVEGERFDPEYHDALLTKPVEDESEDGIVSRVLIDGYCFGDRVLRPARVEVQRYDAVEAGDGEPDRETGRDDGTEGGRGEPDG